jgi:hypothetical protein
MWFLITAACFAAAVVGHALLCRVSIKLDFVAKSLATGIPAALILAGLLLRRHGLDTPTWAGLLLFGFAYELYIFLFTLVSTSVSASLLMKLASGHLTFPEIDQLYSSDSMVETRMEKLVRTGLLERHGEEFRVTAKTRKLLVVFRALRSFFRHPASDGGPR